MSSKIYVGNTVADGFYDSLTHLKACDFEELRGDPKMNWAFNNYDHIIKLTLESNLSNIPPINDQIAFDWLSKLKESVSDSYGMTTLH